MKRTAPPVSRRLIIVAIAGLALIALASWFATADHSSRQTVALSEVTAAIRAGQVQRLTVEDSRLVVEYRDGRPQDEARIEQGTSVYDQIAPYGITSEELAVTNIVVADTQTGSRWLGLALALLPALLFGGLLLLFLRRAQGANNQALSFGKSRARLANASKSTVTFADVAGVDEARVELQEVVEFLKEPEKFAAVGARIPRGVLLLGPPGTGKTLISKAVAGEAGVPFFSISGSEFVEMFVGVGASRVRDLFDQAKRNSPCIVFVDEIDAVGRQRGAGLGGGNDEREQTLNQILVEMDGFDTNTNVIVIAATNRPDVLDPALLRPGRFDRQVVLPRPDTQGRLAILKVHAKGKPLAADVDLEVLAKQTWGRSGADLANILNEGAILSARRNKKQIGMSELEEASERVIAGPERKSRVVSERDKRLTAYHEGGHALVARYLPHHDPVHKVTIVARGLTAGSTRYLPGEDRGMWTKSQFESRLAAALGGHAAEMVVHGEVTTGSEDDISQATELARAMVKEYGMSELLGPVALGHKQQLVFLGRNIGETTNYSKKTTEMIDQEVRRLVESGLKRATAIIQEHRAQLDRLVEFLMQHETLGGELLENAFGGLSPEPAAA